jgi:hypothetical protein
MQHLLRTSKKTEHGVAMVPQAQHEIKLLMSWFQIIKQANTVIAKGFGDNRIPTNDCMPFIGSLKIKEVIHTVRSNPFDYIDEKIIT